MTKQTYKIGMVSLGCPKNQVDAEQMLGILSASGCEITAEQSEADVIVVNTCGFIESAKEESIGAILDAAKMKKQGKCRALIVAGCLAQRYKDELAKEMPEVDHFLGSSDMLKLETALRGGAERMLVGNPADWVVSAADPRRLSTRGASAYLKLAEGCNRTCSF